MNLQYILYVVGVILWIYALVDCLTKPNENKLVWVVVIIFLNVLGAILYLIIGREQSVRYRR